MSIDSLMINVIVILAPILVNIIHELYTKNNGIDENNLFLDITLLSSLYLVTSINRNMIFLDIFITVILVLAMLKKRMLASVIIIASLVKNYYISSIPTILCLQCVIYYVLYFIFLNKKKYKEFILMFAFFKVTFIMLFYIINTNNIYSSILSGIFMSLIFILISFIVIYIERVSSDIVSLHKTLKELEQEKQIRDSLFKITHEIKNPIAVCKSYLDMFDFNNKDHEKYIYIIKEEINKILLLLQDFSCMSKIKINSEIMDINLLLKNVTRQFESVLSSSNIKLIENISDDEVYIEGDYNRLSQVLTNIIKNAKEAKDTNKKSIIKIDTCIKDKNFIISIFDNGIGMDKETLNKIGEPFYTTKKNGTGLGVSLSKEIIKEHGGKIEYESVYLDHTCVKITLPFNDIDFN